MFIQSFTAKESSDDVKEDAALTSTIQGAVKALMEAGSYPLEASAPEKAPRLKANFSEAERISAKEEYVRELDRFYANHSALKYQLKQTQEAIWSSVDEPIDVVTDCGFFDFRIDSKKMSSQTAEIKATFTVWEKRIKENEQGAFEVFFPVNKDTAVYELQLEDGVWKVLREEVKTHLMEGDQAKEQQFDTLGDAVSYADSTTPSNVF